MLYELLLVALLVAVSALILFGVQDDRNIQAGFNLVRNQHLTDFRLKVIFKLLQVHVFASLIDQVNSLVLKESINRCLLFFPQLLAAVLHGICLGSNFRKGQLRDVASSFVVAIKGIKQLICQACLGLCK